MGLSKIRIFIIYFLFSLHVYGDYDQNRVLFLLTQGEVVGAIDLYQSLYKKNGKHNLDLIKQMSLIILDQALKSKEPEDQLMAIFGAGITANESSYYLLEEGMRSNHPQIQLVALNFLGKTQDDHADDLISHAVSSPYLLLRLEAVYQLALKKHPRANAQIEALMHKIDPKLLPVFPKLFALTADEGSAKILRKLLSNPDPEVKAAAILSICAAGRDDLLPNIKKLALQHDKRIQEAAAVAFSYFKDDSCKDLLFKLSKSPHSTVQVAALKSLHELGDEDAKKTLIQLVQDENIFAIDAVKDIPESADDLKKLLKSSSIHLRINATLSLLEQKNRSSLLGLPEILIKDMRDLAFAEIQSPGKAMSAWKAIPSSSHHGEEGAVLHELSLAFKESVLDKCLHLPEEDFLKIAEAIFVTKQNELVPHLVQLLVNLDTPKAIELLKAQEQKAGAPLIRHYAALGLLKLHEEGPYIERLKKWVTAQNETDIVKFRTFIPFEFRESSSSFELTPQETAHLLVDALNNLAETEDNQGVDLLMEVLKSGHPRNRPVVAGMLLRAAQ